MNGCMNLSSEQEVEQKGVYLVKILVRQLWQGLESENLLLLLKLGFLILRLILKFGLIL